MKKVALSLLALALVGSMAFGQDAAAPAVKIGGYLDIGTNTYIGADSGAKTIVKGDDSGVVGGSYLFKINYALSDKAALVVREQVNSIATGNIANITSKVAYLWFLLPGIDMVKVLAGNYDDDGTAWNGLDDKGAKATNGTGVAVQVTPAAGFTIGGGFAPSADGYTPPTYSAGAIFTVPDTLAVAGGLNTANKAWVATVDAAYVTANLLAKGPLSAKGGVNIAGLSAAGSHVQTTDDLTLGYAISDAFSASLLTYVYTYGGDDKTASGDALALSFKVNPSISYTVDPVTSVGLGGTYFSGNVVVGNINMAQFPAGTTLPVANKLAQIEINPNATFTIDANTKVYVNYLYDAISGDDSKGLKDLTSSTFKIDFRYTF